MNLMRVYCAFLALLFFTASCRFGTGIGHKVHTPEKFKNLTTVSYETYKQDSAYLIEHFRSLLAKKAEAFYSPPYFDSTEVSIDTIIYSDTSLQRIATFVIVKNHTSRQIVPKKNDKWYFDAFCYLGIKNDSGGIKLKWLKNFYPINWYDSNKISSLIRDMYFTEFAALKDTSGAPLYGYNLDDRRFGRPKYGRDILKRNNIFQPPSVVGTY